MWYAKQGVQNCFKCLTGYGQHILEKNKILCQSVSPNIHPLTKPLQIRTNLTEMRKKVAHRPYLPCSFYPPNDYPCYDEKSISLEMGNQCTQKMIRSFLYAHYWPREPSTVSSYVSLDSELIRLLTEKYSIMGDRYIAFEKDPRTRERRMVGILIANKIMPWTVDEIDDWAFSVGLKGQRSESARLYLMSRSIREPNLFKKYKIPYIYDFEVLATTTEVSGHRVGELLMAYAMSRAIEIREPIVQMLCKSNHMKKACERIGMKKEWSVKYNDVVDYGGHHLFYNRYPHYTATLYTRLIRGVETGFPDKCKDSFIYKVYKDRITTPITDLAKTKTCYSRENLRYSAVGRKPRPVRDCTCVCYKNIFSKGIECPCKCYRNPMEKLRKIP